MEHPEKRYYTIGEIADMFGVSKSLIRFWDQEFDMLRPHKNSKGERRFTAENIRQFELIYELVKERGFTLKGAQQEMHRLRQREKEKSEILQELQEVRDFLRQLSSEEE
jgi:DNA-binding transcriptional MerR regulator